MYSLCVFSYDMVSRFTIFNAERFLVITGHKLGHHFGDLTLEKGVDLVYDDGVKFSKDSFKNKWNSHHHQQKKNLRKGHL